MIWEFVVRIGLLVSADHRNVVGDRLIDVIGVLGLVFKIRLHGGIVFRTVIGVVICRFLLYGVVGDIFESRDF